VIVRVNCKFRHKTDAHACAIGKSGAEIREAITRKLKLPRQLGISFSIAPIGYRRKSPHERTVNRRLEYVDWARNVSKGLTGVSKWLEGEFEQTAKEAERSTVFHR
jgi:hypothetical protein